MSDSNQERCHKRFEILKSLINKNFSSGKIELKHNIISVSRLKSITGREKNPRIDFYPDENLMTDLDSSFEEVFDQGIQIAKQILENPPLKNCNFQGEIRLTHEGAKFKKREINYHSIHKL